jgi:hypothetical protein
MQYLQKPLQLCQRRCSRHMPYVLPFRRAGKNNRPFLEMINSDSTSLAAQLMALWFCTYNTEQTQIILFLISAATT